MRGPFDAGSVHGEAFDEGPNQVAATAPERIRILIADDQPVVRQGLRAVLNSQPDFNLVGEVSGGEEALHTARILEPDILLLDFRLPGRPALEVMRELHGASERVCRVIVFTAEAPSADLLPLVKYGMRGLILKNSPMPLVCKCIRKVARGEAWLPHYVIDGLVEALAFRRGDEDVCPRRDYGLTAREREVLQLVLEADTNKGIAERLAVSEDTVKHHLTKIFDKTGASTRLELALFAMHHGLLA